jgi:hypothetical protein
MSNDKKEKIKGLTEFLIDGSKAVSGKTSMS